MGHKKHMTIDDAAEKLASAMEKHLKVLTSAEQKKKLSALKGLAKSAEIKMLRSRAGNSSISGGTRHAQAYPFAAKAR